MLDSHEYVAVLANDNEYDKNKLGLLNPYNKGFRTISYTVDDYTDIQKNLWYLHR